MRKRWHCGRERCGASEKMKTFLLLPSRMRGDFFPVEGAELGGGPRLLILGKSEGSKFNNATFPETQHASVALEMRRESLILCIYAMDVVLKQRVLTSHQIIPPPLTFVVVAVTAPSTADPQPTLPISQVSSLHGTRHLAPQPHDPTCQLVRPGDRSQP